MKALLPTLSIVSPILSCQILLWMARLCGVAALIGLMVLVSWGVPWKVEEEMSLEVKKKNTLWPGELYNNYIHSISSSGLKGEYERVGTRIDTTSSSTNKTHGSVQQRESYGNLLQQLNVVELSRPWHARCRVLPACRLWTYAEALGLWASRSF